MRNFLIASAATAGITLTTACATAEQTFEGANAGMYNLEKNHASLLWRVSHSGLSQYTVAFTDFDATINFNPENPVASSVTATINPLGIETNYPDAEGREDWHKKLAGEQYFNAAEFPEITFASTGIEQTGEFTGLLTGDLTFLGVTQPVTLDVTYNGTGNAPWFGPRDLIGFSATGTLTRSDFGLTTLVPNIGDEVEIIIEAEFLEAPGE